MVYALCVASESHLCPFYIIFFAGVDTSAPLLPHNLCNVGIVRNSVGKVWVGCVKVMEKQLQKLDICTAYIQWNL